MRWAPSALAWCLLAGMAHGQSLLRYPGDRAASPIATVNGGGGTQRVAAFGDSITRGVDLDNNIPSNGGPYPVVLGRSLGAGYLVDNHGVGGETTSTGATRFAANVVGKGYATVVVLQGVNDLNFTADSAATICTRLRGMYAAAVADGMDVLAVTILPYGNSVLWSEANEARRVALNACILASPNVIGVNAESTFSDGDPDQPAMLAPLDIGDGIHISQAGANALAALVPPFVP